MIKTKVFKVDPLVPDAEAIEYCGRLLKRGGLVAFPTETVYGLGGNFLNKEAVDRIYKLKRRSRAKPLPIQVADPEAIRAMGCSVTPEAKRLMERFWPGPLTIILKRSSGRKKLGFRIPANRIALELIKKANLPLAVPSANMSDEAPPKDAGGVLRDFGGRIEAVIDAGRTEIGVESTVVDMTGRRVKILRHGAISKAEITAALNILEPRA